MGVTRSPSSTWIEYPNWSTGTVDVAVNVVLLPGPSAVWAAARLTPIQPTETASEITEGLDGISPPGVSETIAWNLCTPASAEYPTAHCVPCEQDPTRVPAVVSKIWIALPGASTFAVAVAVKVMLPPETAAGALDSRVRLGGVAGGRMVATGTLG